MSTPVVFSPHVQLAASFYKEYLGFSIENSPMDEGNSTVLLSFQNQPLLIRESQQEPVPGGSPLYYVKGIENYFRQVHQKTRIEQLLRDGSNAFFGFVLIDCEGNPIQFVENDQEDTRDRN